MQYNFHNEKYKLTDVGGIMKEQFRDYSDPTKYKNYVDPSLSDRNLYKEMVPNGCDWFAQIREAKDSTKEITGRAVRKDAVVLCSAVESVPESWGKEACHEYFRAKAEWFGNFLHERGGSDEGCLKSLAVHLDETTPHATYAWIPIKDGKLQAKNILNRDFLRDLQKDGQEFTFAWIEKWNAFHPDNSLEKMDPYVIDGGRKRLSEAEYKEQKIEEHVAEMQETLAATKQEIGDLHYEKQELEDKTLQAQEAKDLYEQKALELTQAPDIPTYNSVVEENMQLKEELSLKDRLIDSLQETVQHWKMQANEWKDRFSDISKKAGIKLMGLFGYDVSREKGLSAYPNKDVSNGIKGMTEDVNRIDPKSLRTLSDPENDGMFRVAHREKDGSYKTLQGGFETRSAAESWMKNVSAGVKNLSESIDDGMHLHIK